MSNEAVAEGAPDKVDVLVVGAGPAGLAAAEVASAQGARVLVAEAMPSPGRKFLMAGKSGLNLTKMEDETRFLAAFSPFGSMSKALAAFDSAAVCSWAEGLGQEVFVGSTRRVFPKVMKASPLLRAWLGRLAGAGVEMRTRWRWTGWAEGLPRFETPEGPRMVHARAVVLSVGGASWRRLGSDGAWTETLAAAEVPLTPFQPANMGFEVRWSEHMHSVLGQPVKGTLLRAGADQSRGEWVISARGIEGGGVYEVSRAVRDGAALYVDLVPNLAVDEVRTRLDRAGRKQTTANRLRKALGLDPVRRALLMEWGRPVPGENAALAALVKAVPVPIAGPRPLDEAISVAGGVRWEGVDQGLMLRAMPGVFVAGEMLDWEAPTGGYLITGCLATGRLAGISAANWATGSGNRG